MSQAVELSLEPLDIWREIVKNSSEAHFISQQQAVFNKKYSVDLAEVPIGNSLGYSFNLLNSKELFNIDE